MPTLSLIAAVAENRVIGRGNRLPWRLPEDLRRFKELTEGHAVIMGRKTFDSIGRPLPRRANIVISRDPRFSAAGVQAAGSLERAVQGAREALPEVSEIFVIGGAEIYRLALPRSDRLYLTQVHADVPGDAYFPDWNAFSWREGSRESHPAAEGSPAFTYLTLDRL